MPVVMAATRMGTLAGLHRIMQELDTMLVLINDDTSLPDADSHYLAMLDKDLRQCRNDVVDISNALHETLRTEYIPRGERVRE